MRTVDRAKKLPIWAQDLIDNLTIQNEQREKELLKFRRIVAISSADAERAVKKANETMTEIGREVAKIKIELEL